MGRNKNLCGANVADRSPFAAGLLRQKRKEKSSKSKPLSASPPKKCSRAYQRETRRNWHAGRDGPQDRFWSRRALVPVLTGERRHNQSECACGCRIQPLAHSSTEFGPSLGGRTPCFRRIDRGRTPGAYLPA